SNGSDRPERCRVAIRARTESKNGNLCGVRGKVHVLSAPTPGANIVRTISIGNSSVKIYGARPTLILKLVRQRVRESKHCFDVSLIRTITAQLCRKTMNNIHV